MSSRVAEFVEFHRFCCWNDSIVIQLKSYADIKGLSVEQREYLVLFYALSYSVPTAIVCLDNLDRIKRDPEGFWSENKDKLIFQSDRRWVKFNNMFARSFKDFEQKCVFRQLRGKEKLDLEKSIGIVQKVCYFARFAAFLFLEAYCFMFGVKTFNDGIDWLKGDTATSGMLNVLGFDRFADEFDEKSILYVPPEKLSEALKTIQKMIPEQDCRSAIYVETTLCAFRKHFKGTRYAGYYVDRVLGELWQMKKFFPAFRDLDLLLDARAAVIPVRMLGEYNGWSGIRKKLCKHYIATGDWHV